MTITPPRIAVILVNWNGWKDTIECIDTVLESEAVTPHIFVVDNASTDGSPAHITRWLECPKRSEEWKIHDGVKRFTDVHPAAAIPHEVLDAANGYSGDRNPAARVTLIHSGGNLGFAGGNNAGLRLAMASGFQWFWLLNTDTVVATDALAALHARATISTKVGMVGSTLIYYYDPATIQAMGGARLDRRTTAVSHIGIGRPRASLPVDVTFVEKELAYIVGASIFVSRQFVDTVGLMEEDYFLYFEELDWALRGASQFQLAYARNSFVFHKVGAASAKVVSEFSLNLLYRNRIRFVNRFLPERLAATKRSLWFELARHLAKRRWIPAKLVFRTLRDARTLATSAPPHRPS